jgi:hypothetical protein
MAYEFGGNAVKRRDSKVEEPPLNGGAHDETINVFRVVCIDRPANTKGMLLA